LYRKENKSGAKRFKMTFEKLLAEAMDMDNLLENRIRKTITVLLDYYGCSDPEEECNRMIDQFKEDNQ